MKKFVLLMSFMIFCSLGISEASASENVIVNPELERQAKNELVTIYEESPEIELSFIRELYHSDDSIIAYYYHIMNKGELTGFAIVSAKDELGTLLESGNFENGIDSRYGESIKENLDMKAYYEPLGELIFASNSSQLNQEFEMLKEQAIDTINKQGEIDEEYIQHIESLTFGVDINSASIQQEQFENIVDGSDVKKVELFDLEENTFSTLSTDASLPVVRLYQRMSGVANPNSSCGPTAGAMITNYYKSLGYNVRASSYYGGNAALINQLYYMMNSSFIGTNQYSLHNGLETHLNLDKSLWVGKSRGHASGVEKPTYANVVNAIDKNYPLAMLTYLSSDDPYHWTVINGYYSNGDISYLNPDGSSSSSTRVKASLMFESKAGYTYMALK